LFVNEFSKEMAKKLHEKAILKLSELDKISTF
jgi:hypothetical protein